jgi:mono/diheme cytochrome c family protein
MPAVTSARPRWRVKAGPAALALVALAVTAFAGCGMNEDANIDRGRQLFVAKCGTCHTLSQAGTTATIGPNLDAAFLTARHEGADSDTIAGVVSRQIEGPRPAEPDQTSIYMPPDLVTGQDRKDVAAYVGSVAGTGQKPPTVPGPAGAQVFANNGCGGCHTLAVASTTGTVGPVLDDVLPGQSAKEIEQSITDPNAKVEQGFPANTMPATYGDTIQPDDLKSLVAYLVQCAGPKAPSSCSK